MAKKIDCTRSENRPIASASASDSDAATASPTTSAPQLAPERIEREPDAIGADAEEHHMRERHDAGIAEQDVVGGDQQDHHAGLGRDVERLRAREQERRRTGARARPARSGSCSARPRGGSPESSVIGRSPDRGRAGATAARRPSPGCWRRARAWARGSRRSWRSARPGSRRRTSRRPSRGRR